MRTIAQSLTELNTVKENINNAIVSKGGTSSNDMSTFATSITNLPSAELNIEYSTTAPTDTTKLWVETSITPTKTYIETIMPSTLNNGEMLILITTGREHLTLATSSKLDIKLDIYDFYIGNTNNAPVKANSYVYKDGNWVAINTFSPSTLNNLGLWYDISKINETNGTKISALTDYSSNEINATQTTVDYQPILSIDNNIKSIAFDGTNDFLQFNLPLTSETTIFMVAKPSTKSNTYLLSAYDIDGTKGSSPAIISGYSGNFEFYHIQQSVGENRFNFSASTNRTILTVKQVDGNYLSGFRNGLQIYNASPVVSMNSKTLHKIGSSYTSDYANGQINEMIVYNRALTTTEQKQVEQYLSNKWTITLEG